MVLASLWLQGEEKVLGGFMVGGTATLFVGAILSIMFLHSWLIVLGLAVLLGGVAMVAMAVVQGLAVDRGEAEYGNRVIANSRIRSRYGINDDGGMVFADQDELDADDKLYVQVELPDGHVDELRAQPEIFLSVIEGTLGSAMVENGWLKGFTPQLAPAPVRPAIIAQNANLY